MNLKSMTIKQIAKSFLGYVILILFFSFALFTAVPEPYNLYVMNNFFGLLVFIILSSLTFYGLRRIITYVFIYIENKPNIKSVFIRFIWKAILSVFITALILGIIPNERSEEITTNIYNLALFGLLSFLSIFGIADKLDRLLRHTEIGIKP